MRGTTTNIHLCQSCGIPMCIPEDFGTDAKGGRIIEYCSFCFREGNFVNPDLTIHEKIDHVKGRLLALQNMHDRPVNTC